jgi:hypothetical protein
MDELWLTAVLVKIFAPKDECPLVLLGASLSDPEGSRMAEVEITGRRGGYATAVGHELCRMENGGCRTKDADWTVGKTQV